jgi:hypothetical protein
MHKGLLNSDAESSAQCIHVFQTTQVATFEEVALKFVSVGESVRNCHFFQCVFNLSVFSSSQLKLLLFVAQLSIDVYQDALRTYLLRKLDYMSKEDRSQITMVSTWAAELYLDKVRFRFLSLCL